MEFCHLFDLSLKTSVSCPYCQTKCDLKDMMNLPLYIKEIRQKGQRAFTLKQLMADLNLSRTAAVTALSRLKEQGDIITPAKGLYVIVPPESKPEGSIPAPELVPLLMNYLKADYYVSLLSGAQYYGASHQKPGRFQIISNKRTKHPLLFGHIQLEMIYKKTLAKLPTQNFTVKTGYLKVATPELITFDLLQYQKHSGGLNHIATVLSELIEAIDPKKIITLATAINEKAWLQRLGFIIDVISSSDDHKAQLLKDTLQKHLNKTACSFVPLACELPKTGHPRNKKWHVIENTTIESDL